MHPQLHIPQTVLMQDLRLYFLLAFFENHQDRVVFFDA